MQGVLFMVPLGWDQIQSLWRESNVIVMKFVFFGLFIYAESIWSPK